MKLLAPDVDGDGDYDLVLVEAGNGESINDGKVLLFLNTDMGQFANPTIVASGGGPHDAVAGDFDQDGETDLAIANYLADTVSVLFGPGFTARRDEIPVGSRPVAIAAGDIGGNGTLDLLVANYVSDSVLLLPNDGTGDFAEPPIVVGSDRGPSDVETGDFDGDGRLDIAVAYFGKTNAVGSFVANDLVEVWYGSTSAIAQISRIPLGPRSGAQHLHVADVDADGDPDLVVSASERDAATILISNSNRTWSSSSEVAVGAGPTWASTSLVDADGNPDLISAGLGGSYSISLYERGSYRVTVAAGDQLTDLNFGLILGDVVQPPQSGGVSFARMDVDRSGTLELRDALMIINFLVTGDGHARPDYDVDGNGTVAALDVLIIINHLVLHANSVPSPLHVTSQGTVDADDDAPGESSAGADMPVDLIFATQPII